MQKKLLLAVIITLFSFDKSYCQENTINPAVSIGSWRVHHPYSEAKEVVSTHTGAYCLTKGGLFFYNIQDNSVKRWSKPEGLSDADISTINYLPEKSLLLIAYKNANIDLLYQDESIINISDIKKKSIPGNKTINNIHFYKDKAYLSCGFGIVELNVDKREIKETFFLGAGGDNLNVLDLTVFNETIYAATEKGLLSGKLSANLSNFANWKQELGIPQNSVYNEIEVFNEELIVNFSKYLTSGASQEDTLFVKRNNMWNTIQTDPHYEAKKLQVSNNQLLVSYSLGALLMYKTDFSWNYVNNYFNEPSQINDAVYSDGQLLIADNKHGLLKRTHLGTYIKLSPNGPEKLEVSDLTIGNGVLYAVPGGIGGALAPLSYTPGFGSKDNISLLKENEWTQIALDSARYDLTSIAVNPKKPGHLVVGDWGGGVVEILPDGSQKYYNEKNSTLQSVNATNYINVRTIATFDDLENIWVANSLATKPLSVKVPDGTWKSFDLPNFSEGNFGSILSYKNQKWFRAGTKAPQGILVYDDKGTTLDELDDTLVLLREGAGNGNLLSNEVLSLKEDKNGEIWVGTDKGVSVFHSPLNVTNGKGADSQPIIISQGAYFQHLMEGESVMAIEVDGANRKWFGTANSGVFLMSADGTKEIFHFTEENSPLLSNTVSSIEIDGESGEVFFGTTKGIISYKSTATEPDASCSQIIVYPNPVKEHYTGTIGIKGLSNNSDVKITDISGNLVYKTRSEGGQAIWDGNRPDGSRVKTGVYIVFAVSEDGSNSCVTKLLVLN